MPSLIAGDTPEPTMRFGKDEFVILPLEDVLKAAEDPLARLDALLNTSSTDLLYYAFTAKGCFSDARASASEAVCNYGRPSRVTNPRQVIDNVMELFGTIQSVVTRVIADMHGIDLQYVQWVGMSGYDGAVFHLRPFSVGVTDLNIKLHPSYLLPDPREMKKGPCQTLLF